MELLIFSFSFFANLSKFRFLKVGVGLEMLSKIFVLVHKMSSLRPPLSEWPILVLQAIKQGNK